MTPTAGGAVALYTDAVLTAPQALAAVASAVGSRIEEPGRSTAYVPLAGSACAVVAVAKFGDESPVTIDILHPAGVVEARAAASSTAEALRARGWVVTPEK